MAPRPPRSDGDDGRRYTVLVVPDGGAGRVRELRVGLRGLRAALVVAVLLVALALLGVASAVRAVAGLGERERLLRENVVLRTRLAEIEARMEAVDRELARLRFYGAQLAGDEAGSASGAGPAPALDDPLPGELGDPLGDAGLDDRAPRGWWLAEEWSRTLLARADAALEDLEQAGEQVGRLAEDAERWRAMRAAMPTTWPVRGVLTSGFGYRRSPFGGRLKFHRGLDISAPVGTPVVAPAPGVVVTARWSTGYGRMLEIDHGFGIVTRYAHTRRLLVEEGDEVQRGQVVAEVGITGRTTGPHLHYEVMVDGSPVDPLVYLPPP